MEIVAIKYCIIGIFNQHPMHLELVNKQCCPLKHGLSKHQEVGFTTVTKVPK